MSKIGLVFSGGGGKGAYEVGVYKALKEFGVDKDIVAVSGTSVGALNAALFVKDDITQALKVWEEMSPSKILQLDVESVLRFIALFHPTGRIIALATTALGILKSEGAFTQSGLEEIIRASLKADDLKDKIPLYICATKLTTKTIQPLYKKLNDLKHEEIIQYLLATSAIPGVFSKIVLDDTALYDGFLVDNTPLKPLIEYEKCDIIITVLLNRDESIAEKKQSYPDVSFFEIAPSKDTGGLLGNLNFKEQNARELIEIGYEDTKKMLESVDVFATKQKSFTKELAPIVLSNYEMKEIDTALDTLLESMTANTTELQKFAFESIGSLASNTSKINHQLEQSFFSKHLGTLTGSNATLQTDINFNFSNSLYATHKMIEKLHNKGELTLDICVALGNKVSYIIQNQNALKEQNIQQYEMLESLKNGIFTLAEITKQAIDNNSKRIDVLEDFSELHNWSHHLKSKLRGLSEYDKLLRIIGSYLNITKSLKTEIDESEFLYATLLNLDFDTITINPSKFIEEMQKSKSQTVVEMKPKLFLPMPKSYEKHYPLVSIVANEKNQNEICKQNGIDLNVDMSGIDFALELYNSVKMNLSLQNSLYEEKSKMITKLQNTLTILEKDSIETFSEDIKKLLLKIDNFKVIVPVIGKFSSGKSRLLNSYIGEKSMFKTDINPTTAVACELHYDTKNRVEIYAKDSTLKVIPLEHNIEEENALYVKYFLNNEKLKKRKDIVIVDMPGFESSNLNHNNAINHYFNQGQHYILALDCSSPYDNSILKQIKEVLAYGATFSILITKIDKKLPAHIDAIVDDIQKTVEKKYPNQVFFIGISSAEKDDIEDLETIIDRVYENSSKIFVKTFEKELNLLLNEIKNYYKKLLEQPCDTLTQEKKIQSDRERLEEDINHLEDVLQSVTLDILRDGVDKLSKKAEKVLHSNIDKLVKSTKNNTLYMEIANTLRSPLNSMFKKITQEAIQRVEDSSISLSNDIQISFSNVDIETEMTLWEKIKDLFTGEQKKKIQKELEEEIIPHVVTEIEVGIEHDLAILSSQIKSVIDTKMRQKREKFETLSQEILRQIEMQQEELQMLQQKYLKSLQTINEEG